MSKESHPTSQHDSKSTSSHHVRKGDKIFNFFRSTSSKPEVKQCQSTNATLHHLSTVSTQYSSNIEHKDSDTANTEHTVSSIVDIGHVSTTEVKSPVANVQSSLPAVPRLNIFLKNMGPPVSLVSLPEIGSRIETTPQLSLCLGLLLNGVDTIDQQEDPSHALWSAQRAWLDAMKQHPVEQERLRWLGVRMVKEFAKDTSKDSIEIAEMVLIGPVLTNKHYRRLLSSIITAFDQTVLLDVDLLQGLVQLIQSAPSEALLPDDLVKILRVIRVRLQDTHQQSSMHPFHLTLAVSRLLDVMAEHKVKDLNRVEVHEPLSGVLSGLRASSDPYLMYQACYAFQALQYVPNNESPLHSVLRHTTGAVDGLVKVSAAFKLDLGAILEGLAKLQATLGGVVEVADAVYNGVCSLMESGRGVLESMKEGFGSGQKRPWYTAIRVAYALAQAGQLKDLNTRIYEAPCRIDPLFQWGICQLLGEIASDDSWGNNVRLQAIALLGELHRNDPLWGQDESVRTWMLNIIRQLCASADRAVSNGALALLKVVNQDQDAAIRLPYPLRNNLPLPASSPVLARVLAIPDVDFDLHRLKLQRLKGHTRGVYIPPQAKRSLKSSGRNFFPLMKKVLKFLSSERQVFLVLGDSGAGKSTFNLELEHALWKTYKKHGPIPLYINLPTIDNPAYDIIEKHLQDLNFSEDQIWELKLHRQFILICDGYDESQLNVNIHTTNQFNRPGQWKVKMVISCRTQYLGQDYRSRFQPQPIDRYQSVVTDLFQEAVVAAFSKTQIQQYVKEYVKGLPTVDLFHDRPSWTADDYMEKLTRIPNLMDLVSNPFLLTLSLDALPSVVETKKDLSTINITRVQLYDGFVKRWLDVNWKRLETSLLSNDERAELDMLIDDSFIYHGVDYQRRLAVSIYLEQAGNPVVKYTHNRDKDTWKTEFFSPTGQAKLLRESSTVIRSGAFFRFLHRSLLEYFYSRTIYDPLNHDGDDDGREDREPGPDLMTCLSRMNIVDEQSILQFLAERVSQDPTFGQQLRDAIDQSKTDSSAAIASTNAITILVRAGVTFHGEDLRSIKIPGADLSYGQFDSAQFQGANLKGVNLSGSWLRQANLSHAQLEGVQFGEWPYLRMDDTVRVCAYSPDGRMLGMALWEEMGKIGDGIGIEIFDTSTWQRINLITVTGVTSVAFSPDSQQMLSGHDSGKVRSWDYTSGEELLVMEGHTDAIRSVACSPCGNRIASSSLDKTVRLWDLETGQCVFVFEGHTAWVIGVRFSPDGRQLISGSKDGTIRFWDTETGKPGVVLSPSLEEIYCLAFSADGRWIASGHEDGNVRLWDIVSDKPGPLLQDHTDLVTGIAFSPNVKLIATASRDRKEKLWNVSTGDLIATFDDHTHYIWDIAFSPDNLTIASASDDGAVRLWRANSSPSRTAIQALTDDVVKVAYSLDGLSILTVDCDGIVRQGDATTGARGLVSFELPDPESVKASTFSADGNWIATGCDDGTVRLWNSCTGAAGPVLEGHSSAVRILAYSTCGRWIASSDRDTVRLWDLHDTEQRSVLVEGGGDNWDRISDLKFSPEGHQLAINSGHGTVWFFDCHTKDPSTSKKPMKNGFMAFDFSPDGQQLALGTSRSIALWNLQSDEPNLKLKVPSSMWRDFGYMTIAYSPTGEFLASYNDDNVVLLWHRQSVERDTETWSSTFVLSVFHDDITSLSWNPVVPTEFTTASKDGSVRLWRVSSDDEPVAVKMLWGTNLRRLCSAGVVLEGTTGLDPIHRRLLAQRSAFIKGLPDDSEYRIWPEYGVSLLGLEATDDWSNGGSADEPEDDDGSEDEE